jgi:hypothetical protein
MFAPTLSSLGAGEAPRMTGGCTGAFGRDPLGLRLVRARPQGVSPFTLGLSPASGASPPLFPLEAKSNLAVSPSTQLCRQPPPPSSRHLFTLRVHSCRVLKAALSLWAHFTLSERSISQTSSQPWVSRKFIAVLVVSGRLGSPQRPAVGREQLY